MNFVAFVKNLLFPLITPCTISSTITKCPFKIGLSYISIHSILNVSYHPTAQPPGIQVAAEREDPADGGRPLNIMFFLNQ